MTATLKYSPNRLERLEMVSAIVVNISYVFAEHVGEITEGVGDVFGLPFLATIQYSYMAFLMLYTLTYTYLMMNQWAKCSTRCFQQWESRQQAKAL